MELTGWTLNLMLRASLGDPMTTAMYEGLCAGNALSRVLGVMVCYAPTLDLLRRAAAERKNLIISRKHPFFLHGGLHYTYRTDGLESAMKDDPGGRAKPEIITPNHLLIYPSVSAWNH